MVIVDRDYCCGCEVCSLVCPLGCIEMSEEEDGFLYPRIDNEKCIECGKCRGHCPVYQKIQEHSMDKSASVER